MEKMQIMGHIGKDAVVREVNGKKAINFNIAVNSSYKQSDGVKIEKTNWYNCTKWINGLQSDGIVQYLNKGKYVLIEGKLNVSLYKDKNNVTQIDLGLTVEQIYLTPDINKTKIIEQKTEQISELSIEILEQDLPF